MKAIFTSAVPCQRTTVTPTSFVTDTNTTPCCTLRRSLSFRIRQKPWEEQEGLRKIAQRYRRKTCVFPKSKHFLKGPFAGQHPQLPAHTLLGQNHEHTPRSAITQPKAYVTPSNKGPGDKTLLLPTSPCARNNPADAPFTTRGGSVTGSEPRLLSLCPGLAAGSPPVLGAGQAAEAELKGPTLSAKLPNGRAAAAAPSAAAPYPGRGQAGEGRAANPLRSLLLLLFLSSRPPRGAPSADQDGGRGPSCRPKRPFKSAGCLRLNCPPPPPACRACAARPPPPSGEWGEVRRGAAHARFAGIRLQGGAGGGSVYVGGWLPWQRFGCRAWCGGPGPALLGCRGLGLPAQLQPRSLYGH